MKEVWADIPGYEGLYKISNLGNLWSEYAHKVLSVGINNGGYAQKVLTNAAGRKALQRQGNWYTDGYTNKFIKPDQQPPLGYELGFVRGGTCHRGHQS